MTQERNAAMPEIATSSAIVRCPRKVVIAISAEDSANMAAQLAEDGDFTIRGGDLELVFTRRKAYWPGKSRQ